MQSLASQMPQMPKRGGMFGGDGKFGVGQAIVAALNGYLASQGNPVGIANMRMMQEAAQAKRDEAQYEQRRQQQLQDQISLYDYKAQHSQPDYGEFERALIASGVQPGTPQWQEMMARRRDNMLDPIVNTAYGPTLRSIVTGGIQAPPTAPVGKLTPVDEGGAGQAAPRPFPY
jgi:hypothetical protein